MHVTIALLILFAADDPPKPPPQAASAADGVPTNLLGRVNTQAGESRRNENVSFNLIDNNALKELAVRMGTTATIHPEFAASRNYFGTEFGGSPAALLHVPAAKHLAGVHGTLFWTHSNSATSARSFFQVGGVRPARDNHFGVNASTPLWRNAWLSVEAARQLNRGFVNGNVLVPLPSEREILAVDPRLRSLLTRWISAYPNLLPNRPDIDPRALNTNAPQAVTTDNATLRLDQTLNSSNRIFARHIFTNQNVDAFQLVAGQNPDTNTKSHASRLTWQRAFSPSTTGEFSAGFDRVHSLLVPEPNAVGPQVTIGTAWTSLGPGSGIPIDRVTNRFRYATLIQQSRGRHKWNFGAELTRLQVNGREASSDRGNYYFRNDFGRDAILNFRLGVPNRISGALGDTGRGFRNWEQHYFIGDNWQASRWLTLSYGLRFQPQTGPTEVAGRSVIPFRCDCNNWAPRFGFAAKLPGKWGVLRSAYGMQFGEIFPQTFQQVRWNPPGFLKFEVQAPNPLDPLAGADLRPNARAIVFLVPPDLKTPYSHQYNATWEAELPQKWRLQFGYVGTRTHKLLMIWYANRAQPVAGIPQTTATINQRRANPDFFEMRYVMNGARAYFDAGRVTLLAPSWRGMTLDASYWFSKAIDTGATYLNTAAGDDARQGYSQGQGLVRQDLRGPSVFDQSHAFLMRWRYGLPALRQAPRWVERTFGRWDLSSVWLAKTGMPFTVIAGSDGPGFGNVDGTNGDRPNIVDPSILGRHIKHPDTSKTLLPRSAFAFMRPTDARGNLGVGVFRRAGILNLNGAVARTWAFPGDRALTFRAEAINATNSPQFADPNFDLTSPAFGQITNTLNDGRAFRLTLQARF